MNLSLLTLHGLRPWAWPTSSRRGSPCPSCFAFAAGDAGEALLVAALIERWFARPFELDNLKSMLGLLGAAAIGTAVWEAITAVMLGLAGHTATPFGPLWSLLAWANFTGIVMVAPLLTGLAAAVGRNAELAARRSEAQLRLGLDAGKLGTWELDPETGAFQASPRARHYFGLAGDSPLSFDNVKNALHPGDWQACQAKLKRLVENGGEIDCECRVQWPDGSERWLQVMGRAASDGPGGLRRIVGAVCDITEHKSIASLRESAQHLRLFVEQAPVAIAMFDSSMHYVAASLRWMTDFGLDGRDLASGSHCEAVAGIPDAWKEAHRRGMAGQVTSAAQDPFTRPGGHTQWLRWEARPWRGADGSIGGVVIFTEDVTAFVEAERALRDSRNNLDRAQAVARTGSWRLDAGREELTWSGEASCERFLAAVHPCDREYVGLRWKAALAGVPYDIEHRIAVDGKTKWVRGRAELEFDEAGELLGGFGTVQDITDKKQAEEQLLHQQRLTQLIAEGAADAIFLTDENGIITFANPEAERTFGFGPKEMMGKVLHCLLHEHRADGATFAACDCALSRIQLTGAPVRNHEDVFFRKDGSRVEVSYSYAPLEIEGRRNGAVLVARNIGAQKAAQTALRESEERLRAIVSTAVDAIVVIDEAGVVQSINPAGERMFGYMSREILGRNVSMLMPEPHRSAHDSYLAAYRRTNEAKIIGIGREVECCRKDGSLFAAELAIAEWRVAGERYFTGTVRDITERKHHEEKIQLLLREVNHRAKNMLALVQAIASQTAAPESREFVKRFSERILALAASQDLLVSSGWKGVEAEALVRSQLSHFENLIDNRIKLAGPQLKLSAAAAQSIGMALHELATNAGKYGALSNNMGEIEIEWRLGGQAASDGRFALTWTEHAGPVVSAPARPGFGTTVIEAIPRMELDAEITLDYAPEGLRWRLECPAGSVLEIPVPDIGTAPPPEAGTALR
ncbi:MAG: PAS domain S-box protein [Rhodomicrobium sp.]|nr:PAS domain S-box protein [Rhodomicrobium sp.]